jgi:hypothetical protein
LAAAAASPARGALDDPDLDQHAKVNSPKQSANHPTSTMPSSARSTTTKAPTRKMSDYFSANAPGRANLVADIANWIHAVEGAEE